MRCVLALVDYLFDLALGLVDHLFDLARRVTELLFGLTSATIGLAFGLKVLVARKPSYGLFGFALCLIRLFTHRVPSCAMDLRRASIGANSLPMVARVP